MSHRVFCWITPNITPMDLFTKVIKTPTKLFTFKEINMSQLSKMLSEIKKSNSSSIDGISSKMIQIIISTIKPLLLKLINTTIKSKIFPTVTKISKILPHKKNNDNPTNLANLRPIHIISFLSKIVEKLCSINSLIIF